VVREFERPVFLDVYYRGGRRDPVAEDEYTFTRTLDGQFGWIAKSAADRVVSTEQLADHFLKQLLDRTHRPTCPRDEDDW
jgi:hypothetical protein